MKNTTIPIIRSAHKAIGSNGAKVNLTLMGKGMR